MVTPPTLGFLKRISLQRVPEELVFRRVFHDLSLDADTYHEPSAFIPELIIVGIVVALLG
jgi:hypothetical protein